MSQKFSIQLFEHNRIRTIWDEGTEEWYFVIIDVCSTLNDTDYQTARNYWKVLKGRLIKEGFEPVTNCYQLKIPAQDGKLRLTDVANSEQLFRIIQSIPSKKAEPFKQWIAKVAAVRLEQMQNPELNFEQAYADYCRLGYSDKWITQRLKSIEIRKELTDEWKRVGITDSIQYASLTDIITQEWSGKTTRQYKIFKGLHKESLRDNMTNLELALNILAEASTTEISKTENPCDFTESKDVARRGGRIAGEARKNLETQIKHSVISPNKASDFLIEKEKD